MTRAMIWSALALFAIGSLVHVLAAMAPRSYAHPVSPAAVSTFDSACAGYGPAVEPIVATGQSGGLELYTITCANGGNPISAQLAR